MQHGVLSHAQLVDCGMSDYAIKTRTRQGRLHPVQRGVYAVGHPFLTVNGDRMAAVLAGGPTALLSHLSAAQIWGLLGGRQRPIHVTVARNGGRKDRGVRFHHPRSINPDDRDMRHRIPVTSVARTLLDIAPGPQLETAFEEAIRLDLLDATALLGLLDRSHGRRGARKLRHLAGNHLHSPDDTRPGLEAQFAAFCRRRAIPPPSFNGLVGDHLVDAVWPAEELVVELDSRAFHGTWEARERDVERDGNIQVLGYRVLRVTAGRLRRDGDGLEHTLRQLLATPRPASGATAAPSDKGDGLRTARSRRRAPPR